MKHLKIVSWICVLCLLLAISTPAFASSTPTVSVTITGNGRSADIKLSGADMMFYSAQLTLSVTPKTATYTFEPSDKNAYATTDLNDSSLTIYLDNTTLADGSKQVSLGTLKANREMSIGNKAELILLDRSMRPVSYNSVKVTVKNNTSSSQSGGGSGGSVTSSGGNSLFMPNIPDASQQPTSTSQPATSEFIDVPNNHWAKSYVSYVTNKGLFQGVGEGKFEPNMEMTRAMFVTVLNRFGAQVDPKWSIQCNTPIYFGDVEQGQWYSDAIAWAGGTRLVNGIGEDKFGPTDPITREQIAVMIVNFAQRCGVQLPVAVEAVEFPDAADIHDWASDAVRTAQQAGLLNGREHGEFAPQATATRAEVAAILQRLAEMK